MVVPVLASLMVRCSTEPSGSTTLTVSFSATVMALSMVKTVVVALLIRPALRLPALTRSITLMI